MRIIEHLEEMTETARGWLAGGTVGFVPLMSSTHHGHRSLLHAAKASSEICVVSITANPWLFDSKADSANYATDLTSTLRVLNLAGTDVVFIPRPESLYPSTFDTYVMPIGSVAERLEGGRNPEAIRNFATLMVKLFHLIRPDIAYFGYKDAQQVAILRKIVQDLNIDINLRILPTVREPDGLAMSSRNAKLTPEERQATALLYQALLKAKEEIDAGEKQASVLKKVMVDLLATHPLLTVDYIAICHPDTLIDVQEVTPGTMLIIAADIGQVHLFDNIVWLKDGRWQL